MVYLNTDVCFYTSYMVPAKCRISISQSMLIVLVGFAERVLCFASVCGKAYGAMVLTSDTRPPYKQKPGRAE